LSIPDFALYDPPIETIRPWAVNPHLRVKFCCLRSFHHPAKRPSPGVLRWEDVSVPISSAISRGEGRDRTHGEKPFLLSEDGNRKMNFAGWVNEQFEITNVTGTLHDLDTE
jgi:hypothetical protein